MHKGDFSFLLQQLKELWIQKSWFPNGIILTNRHKDLAAAAAQSLSVLMSGDQQAGERVSNLAREASSYQVEKGGMSMRPMGQYLIDFCPILLGTEQT